MSMSDTYLDYLDSRIEIAPANSQEEVMAADAVAAALEADGLEVTRQDVVSPNDTRFVTGVLLILAFLGMVVSGIGGVGLAVLGFVIALASGGLLALRYLGIDLFARFMPPARSQNVIGFHKGTGPHAGRGVRPIVIMAHYDTGHEEPLANPSVARFSPLVYRWAPVGLAVAAVCCVLQMVVAIPEPALRVIWVIGMVCAVPGLAWGVNNVSSHFMALTGAANDNNASLAAMLGVAEDIFGASDEERAERRAMLGRVAADEQAQAAELADEVEESLEEPAVVPVPRPVEVEETVGVRHGKAVVEALGILPETCDVEYVTPVPVMVEETVEEAVEDDGGDVEEATELQDSAFVIPDFLTRKAQQPSPAGDEAEATGRIQEAPSVGEPVPRSHRRPRRDDVTVRSVAQESTEQMRPVGQVEADDGGEDVPAAADTSVADASATMAMPVQEQAADAVSDVVDDPSWGQSSFTPHPPVNVARRAALFDLPDPTEAQVDPLAPSDSGSMVPVDPADFPADDFDTEAISPAASYEVPGQAQAPAAPGVAAAQPRVVVSSQSTVRTRSADGTVTVSRSHRVQTVSPADDAEAPRAVPIEPVHVSGAPHDRGQGRKRGLKDRLASLGHASKGDQDSLSDWLGVDEDFDAKADGERIGSWDRFSDDDADDGWKGGASRSAETRDDVDQGGDPELQEAVLDMDYVDLVAHDVWFVAVGASELDHAGSKAFVDAYRKDLRGAFLVNLDSVGAGQLTLLTEEGLGNVRKVDRRLLKTIDRIARDLHVHLECKPRPWADTDATYAMRHSIRSATLMGCDPGEVAALSHTAENVPQNVSPDQVAQVNRIVSEMIRRS